MIVNAAKEGDKICLECLEVTAKALGVCCVNLFRVLDPEVYSSSLCPSLGHCLHWRSCQCW